MKLNGFLLLHLKFDGMAAAIEQHREKEEQNKITNDYK